MSTPAGRHPRGYRYAAAATVLALLWLGGASALSAQPAGPPTTAPEQLTTAQKAELDMLSNFLHDETLPADRRRDTAVLLLNKGWQAAEAVVADVLSSKDSSAGRLAVAEALAAESARNGFKPSGRFVEPLIAALADGGEPLRRAAARALAGYSEQPEVVARLRALAADGSRPAEQRRGAVSALGAMPPSSPAIIDALVAVLDDKDAELRTRALDALNGLTGDEINDVNARKQWWNLHRSSPPIVWISRLNQRLRQDNLSLRQQGEQLEKRLTAALKAIHLATPEPQQADSLGKLLGDSLAAVRVLGLELVDQTLVSKNLPVPEAIRKLVSDRLADESARVRMAAANVVPYIGEPKAAPAVLAQLAAEAEPGVRARLIKALGLLRSAEAVAPLLKLLADSKEQAIVAESATALGAIARARGAGAAGPDIEPVVAGLLARYARLAGEEPLARDAIIGAMVDVADIRFAPICLKHLADESASLRLACARGLGNMAPLPPGQAALQAEVIDAMVGRLPVEPDRGVRLALIPALVKFGPGKTQIKAVYERTNANTETDEPVRKRAWDGLVEMLKSADKPTQLTWVGQLESSADPAAAGKLVELLRAIEPVANKSDQWTPAERSSLAERLARALMRINQPAEAAQKLEPEYHKLRLVASERAHAVALLYLGALLAANQGPQAVAVLKDRLPVANAADGAALADGLFTRLRALIGDVEHGGPAAALAWIQELRKQLPAECKSAPWAEQVNKLAGQARDAAAGATSKPE